MMRRSTFLLKRGLTASVVLGLLSACSSQASENSQTTAQTQGLVAIDAKTLETRKAELNTTLNLIRSSIEAEDFGQNFDLTVLPKVQAHIARKFGISRDKLRNQTNQSMAQIYATIDRFEYSFDMDKAEWKTLPDGTLYVLLPIFVEMDMGGKTITADDENVGIYLNKRWYVTRVSEAKQEQLLKTAYPQFKNVSFKRVSMDIKPKGSEE